MTMKGGGLVDLRRIETKHRLRVAQNRLRIAKGCCRKTKKSIKRVLNRIDLTKMFKVIGMQDILALFRARSWTTHKYMFSVGSVGASELELMSRLSTKLLQLPPDDAKDVFCAWERIWFSHSRRI
ncbi:hypothetical protein ACH5RR_039722 [Cinchona calisaya]|uniref:Uncharacterized protein n=1 Tax=Cinchona calisaya TaxID=153742 RepID=A0ABD2Y4C8_9GENT